MRTWTEQTRVEHHWVLTQTERDEVMASLRQVTADPATSASRLELLEGVIAAAETVVSGPVA